MAELETLKATLETKTGEHADAEKQLADNKVLLEDTKVQLEADEKFFEETKASCKAKAAEWSERTRLRTEEINGIQKAITILEGGADTFKGAYTTLLQLSGAHQTISEMEKDRNAAFSMLQKLVRKGGGMRL